MNEMDVLKLLETVIDPEIGIDIVNLGFIEKVKISGDSVKIILVLTSPFCPFTSYLLEEIRSKLKPYFSSVSLEISDKPWTMDRLSEKAKKMLGFSDQ
jgi:metal-sulfur cluster biosynthetic enzyme